MAPVIFCKGLCYLGKSTSKFGFNPKLAARAIKNAERQRGAVLRAYDKTLQTVRHGSLSGSERAQAIWTSGTRAQAHAGQVVNVAPNGNQVTTTILAGPGNPMLRVTSRGGKDVATLYRYGEQQMRATGAEANRLIDGFFAGNKWPTSGRLMSGTSTRMFLG